MRTARRSSSRSSTASAPARRRPRRSTSRRGRSPRRRPGTRDPVVVRFPAPLDHALALRAIGVETPRGEPLDGDVSIDAADTRWQLVPREPWRPGRFTLVALDALEDPAGNRLGRAFEVPVAGAAAHESQPRRLRVFEVLRH